MKQTIISIAAVVMAMIAFTSPARALDVPVDSRWSDGFIYYVVTESDASRIHMMGGTLHEGGYELTISNNGGVWRVEPMHADFPEYAAWAEVGCEVNQGLIEGHDLLLAVGDDDGLHGVLERVEVSELEVEQSIIFGSLQGKFIDEKKGHWQFLPEGKVMKPGMKAAEPYSLVMIYEMPSGIIRLPGGQCVSAVTGLENMELYEAIPCEGDPDCWEMRDEPLLVLERAGGAADVIDWAATHVLFTGSMSMWEPTELEALADALDKRPEDLAAINAEMLRNYINATLTAADDADEE